LKNNYNIYSLFVEKNINMEELEVHIRYMIRKKTMMSEASN